MRFKYPKLLEKHRFLKKILYKEDPTQNYDLRPRKNIKVKWTILHLECWWGAHLSFYGREPVGG